MLINRSNIFELTKKLNLKPEKDYGQNFLIESEIAARIVDKLEINEADHILEIGCGWGAFAEYAAREYGCFVTGISLSKEQLAYANARIKDSPVADKIHFKYCDYRDLNGKYDAIVSIEMLEAVGEEWWPTYFNKVASGRSGSSSPARSTITRRSPR